MWLHGGYFFGILYHAFELPPFFFVPFPFQVDDFPMIKFHMVSLKERDWLNSVLSCLMKTFNNQVLLKNLSIFQSPRKCSPFILLGCIEVSNQKIITCPSLLVLHQGIGILQFVKTI
jgi:hypothetical protein